MTTTLILIRHGETAWNRERRVQGHRDSPLTEAGIAQAEACARRLQSEDIDSVVASDLERVRHTVRILTAARNLPLHVSERWRERCYGVGEGQTYAELEAAYPELFARARSTDPDFALAGGETRRNFQQRIADALADIAATCGGKRVLVVTHGGVLGVIYRLLNDLPITGPQKVSIPNVAYNRATFSDGHWQLDVWADTSHLPAPTFEAA